MINQYKRGDSWCIWNTTNGKTADIVKIYEHHALIKRRPRYRVDVGGYTVGSMIEHFQTAKKLAAEKIK